MFDVWPRAEGIKDWSTELSGKSLSFNLHCISSKSGAPHEHARAEPHSLENLVIHLSKKNWSWRHRTIKRRPYRLWGSGKESGVNPSGEEYVIAEVRVCISSTPLVSAVNHMATQTFREEKTNNKKLSLSFDLILMSTLTW